MQHWPSALDETRRGRAGDEVPIRRIILLVWRTRFLLALLLPLLPASARAAVEWRSLAPGLELAEIVTRGAQPRG